MLPMMEAAKQAGEAMNELAKDAAEQVALLRVIVSQLHVLIQLNHYRDDPALSHDIYTRYNMERINAAEHTNGSESGRQSGDGSL